MKWASAGRRRRRDGQRGVALVEFAIIAPLLILLVFGVIEFGYGFKQDIDLRHGAREGARLAAVNYKETASPTAAVQQTQIVNEICRRMDGDLDMSINLFRTGAATVGAPLEVRVRISPYRSLTGLFPFLNGRTLQSVVVTRLEQDATWQNMANATTFVNCP